VSPGGSSQSSPIAFEQPYMPLGPEEAVFPAVQVRLLGTGLQVRGLALVDTGSNISLIPRGFALALGVAIKGGTSKVSTGGGRTRFDTCAAIIQVLNEAGELMCVCQGTFRVPQKTKDDIEFVVLGRDMLFGQYDEVAFDERRNVVRFRALALEAARV
jgi:hypothetical protein